MNNVITKQGQRGEGERASTPGNSAGLQEGPGGAGEAVAALLPGLLCCKQAVFDHINGLIQSGELR